MMFMRVLFVAYTWLLAYAYQGVEKFNLIFQAMQKFLNNFKMKSEPFPMTISLGILK